MYTPELGNGSLPVDLFIQTAVWLRSRRSFLAEMGHDHPLFRVSLVRRQDLVPEVVHPAFVQTAVHVIYRRVAVLQGGDRLCPSHKRVSYLLIGVERGHGKDTYLVASARETYQRVCYRLPLGELHPGQTPYVKR
jgi:hypothetical protein